MRRVLPLLLVAALAGADGAAADDRSVNRAWDSDDATYRELGKQHRRGLRIVQRDGTKIAVIVRACRRALRALRGTVAKVRSEKPSTELGRRAKRLALASMRDFRAFFKLSIAGYRAGAKGLRRDDEALLARARSRLRRSNRVLARSRRKAKAGKRLFRQAERQAAVAGHGP